MARPKKNEEAEENEGQSSNDLLSSLLKENKDSHYNDVISKNRVISTGSLLLDSMVKVRSGGVIRLVAKTPESGKTSESFVLAENYMKVMPKSKTLYIKAEGRFSQEMQKRVGLKFVTTPEDWVSGTVFILSSNVFETVADFIIKLSKQMYENGEHLCVIIDSLDGLILKKDLETKGIDGNTMVAGVPKLTKLLFRHLSLPISHYDMLLLITGQYSAEIKLDPYSASIPRMGETSGGASVPHQCDYVLQYLPRYQGDMILEKPDEKPDITKNKTLGVYVTIEIKKSATDVTGSKIKIPIKKGRVGCAIWKEMEICDMLLAWSMVSKGGAGWFTLNSDLREELKKIDSEVPEKIQGLNNIRLYLESQPLVTDYLYEKFKNIISE